MNFNTTTHLSKRLFLLLLIGFTVQSMGVWAQQKNTKQTDQNVLPPSKAHFEYFQYVGNDDFYNENPLPGPGYFYNPVLPGWYSDPSICTNGKDYFLVTSSFSYFPGVPIFHSTDLVNWKQIGHVLDRPEQLPLDGQRISEGIFAPAITYNPFNETYYMVTTNIRKGNFFVKTKDPFGPWSDPIWLPEVQGIDPSFYFDEDGRAYILNNDAPDGPALYDGHRAIRIQEFDVEKDITFGPRKMLINGGVDLSEKPVWIEGPHLYKVNGRYLLMAAEGGTSVNHREVIFYGDSPMGDFVPWEQNPILTQKHLDPARKNPITCAGHADLVQTLDGEWWSVFLACRPIDNQFENLGRETFLMPVRWSDDGFPYLTQGDEVVPMVLYKEGVTIAPDAPIGNFSSTYQFSEKNLGHDWFTLRGPATELYSFNDKPGHLSLVCTDVHSAERKMPALVSRRLQHHKFECTTKLDFLPQQDNEAAGLLLLKDERHQYLFAIKKSGNKRVVVLEKVGAAGAEVVAEKALPSSKKPLKLKITSTGTNFDFHYAFEGEKDWNLLTAGVDAYYLSTAQSFGFTGTTIGLYATSKSFNDGTSENRVVR